MNSATKYPITSGILLRASLPVGCSIILVWVYFDQVSGIDIAKVMDDTSEISHWAWFLAGLLTWISFAAVSRYDPILQQVLGFDIPPRRAASMSWKATAISQIVGFGLLTGTLVRWMELGLNPKRSSDTLWQAFKLTVSVSTSFLAAWAVVTITVAGALLLDLGLFFALSLVGFIVLRLALKSNFRLAGMILRHRKAAFALILLTLIDTLFAALVIYSLLPPDLAAFSTLYLAFLMSYAVGLVSGLPGGLGPFEICMIALLPSVDPSTLAPALVGFRIIYFAVPAILAVMFLGLQRARRASSFGSFLTHPDVPQKLRKSAPPDQDLVYEKGMKCSVTQDGSNAALTLEGARTIVQLGNPFGPLSSGDCILSTLYADAGWSKRSFCIYRCNKTTAANATSLGLKALKFSAEAIVRPSNFTLDIPGRSGLRRKIRKAKKAAITINSRKTCQKALSALDQEWVSRHGPARGFSTGRFSIEVISKQRVYVAYQDNSPIAFVSFSMSNDRWLLDLIRYQDACPDGAIYMLVAQAIADAREANIKQVSLGSVPCAPPLHSDRLYGWIAKAIYQRSSGLKGLYQFKNTFDPDWQDRYFVANSIGGAVICCLAIRDAIFGRQQDKQSESRS